MEGSYIPKLAELGVLCMPASFVTYQRPQGLMQDCLWHWAESQYIVTQIGVIGGFFLIPLPCSIAKGYDTIMFQGPATSLRLPLTHSELSLETILNKVSAV